MRSQAELDLTLTESSLSLTNNQSVDQTDTSIGELKHQPNHIHMSPHVWRRERGRKSQGCMLWCTPSSSQINSFNQGMVISSQSNADETNFSQIGANPTDLGFGVFSII